MKIHTGLTQERWSTFSLFMQLANVGCDVDRAIRARRSAAAAVTESERAWQATLGKQAFDRALELLDATIQDPKHKGPRLRELLRVRETLLDHFLYDNVYQTTEESWQRYFYEFNYAAALERASTKK